MNNRSRSGLSWLSILGSLLVLGILGAAIWKLVIMKNTSRGVLTVQSQRNSYQSVQQELVAQGIDPTRVITPVGTIGNATLTSGSGGNATTGTLMGSMSATISSANNANGAGSINALNVAVAQQTNGRAGGVGLQGQATGNATTTAGSTLQPPTFAYSGSLPFSGAYSSGTFPSATAWFQFPANPPGTVYYYTIDGSTPTPNGSNASTGVWNLAAATALSSLPATIKMVAHNADPAYSDSSVVSQALTYQLPMPVMSRTAGGSSTVVTYSDVTSNNNLAAATAAAIPSMVSGTLKYTTDGSNPISSGTAQTYSAAVAPTALSWTFNGGSSTYSSTYYLAVVGNGAQVLSSSKSYTLTTNPTQLPTPSLNPSGNQLTMTNSAINGYTDPTVYYTSDGSSPASASNFNQPAVGTSSVNSGSAATIN